MGLFARHPGTDIPGCLFICPRISGTPGAWPAKGPRTNGKEDMNMRSLYFGGWGVDLVEDGITVDTLYYEGHRTTAKDKGQVDASARRWERGVSYVS